MSNKDINFVKEVLSFVTQNKTYYPHSSSYSHAYDLTKHYGSVISEEVFVKAAKELNFITKIDSRDQYYFKFTTSNLWIALANYYVRNIKEKDVQKEYSNLLPLLEKSQTKRLNSTFEEILKTKHIFITREQLYVLLRDNGFQIEYIFSYKPTPTTFFLLEKAKVNISIKKLLELF